MQQEEDDGDKVDPAAIEALKAGIWESGNSRSIVTIGGGGGGSSSSSSSSRSSRSSRVLGLRVFSVASLGAASVRHHWALLSGMVLLGSGCLHESIRKSLREVVKEPFPRTTSWLEC